MRSISMRWRTFTKGSLAVLATTALAGAMTAGSAAPASADPKKYVNVTYPSASAAAAAQPGDEFDLDVEVSHAGTLAAEIRAVRGGPRQWLPVELATEASDQQVAAGPVTVLAEAPEGAEPGDYDLRVRLIGDDDKIISRDRVRGGVTIEDYGLATGFERADATSWTDFEQEQSFLAAVAGDSPRAALTVLGETVNGLPYNLLTIGAPTPPSPDEVEGDAVLLVCSQHGDEPSGREACLQQARRLAFTADARTREYLSDNTVLVIPAANPDGSMANTRRNANNADLNRDHLRLAQPETRMLGEVMRDAHPEIVHDLHEMSGQDRPHLEVIWGRHLGIDEAVRAFGSSWGSDWVRPRVEAAGYRTGPYGPNPGTGENVTLTNGAMLRNLVGVISETNTSVLEDEGETPRTSRQRRVEVQEISISETLRQHRAEREAMTQAFDDARQRNIEMGYTQEGPYYFTGNSESSEPPPADAFIMDVPCGYLLTSEQAEDRRDWMGLFDVTAQETSSEGHEVFVPMWQANSAVIPLMFDARAAGSNEIEATPVDDCSTVEP